jgi:periplasmic copper chaperone A
MAMSLLAAAVLPVAAHATLPDGSAIPSGGSAVVHLRIPHGCSGEATTAVSVQLPDGVVGAKPQLLAGWTATTTKVPASYTLYGTDYTERVGTIRWEGGPLPDDEFLDFGISATFQLPPGEYALPAVQECGSAKVSWIEIPAAGQSHDDLEHPAPEFTVVEATAADDHDHAASTPGSASAEEAAMTMGDTAALTTQVDALTAKVASLEQAVADSATVTSDATASGPDTAIVVAVLALIVAIAGLGAGVVAVRRAG